MKSPRTSLVELLQPVAEGMERVREILGRELAEESGAVSDMTAHVGRFRGKQLRAGLVLLSGEATGNTTDEHATVASIVEMIHLATLVHDDILDGAEVRRRVACVNQRWDNQVAVLLGDFLYARAFALSTELSSRLCSRILAATTRTICVSEIEQSARRYDFDINQADYETIAGGKTASLYAAACELGARYPGANDELGTRMHRFGWELGLAFQIIDDCLDLVGTEDVVGKSVGNDVEDGKATLPVLHTYLHADEPLRARIRDIYTQPGLEERAAHLREACDLGPGIAYATARAEELARSAREAISTLPAGPARASLDAMAEFILRRNW